MNVFEVIQNISGGQHYEPVYVILNGVPTPITSIRTENGFVEIHVAEEAE